MTPEQLLRHYDEASLWEQPGCGLEAGAAYASALAVRGLRVARGEQPRGFKIGFTNRTIWPRYGVYGPIWGTVWDTTLSFCEEEGEVPLRGLSQPRLEPECVFGIAATPPAGAGLQALRDCIEWIAPGFEIVQSHQPGWKFTAADTVADAALHARLLVGRRVAASGLPPDAGAFGEALASARVTLHRGQEQVDAGTGANVLDGPLHALHHFLQELRACPGAPGLQPGDVVTTGTWTDAWSVQAGEQWRAEFSQPLPSLAVKFT